MPKDQNHQEMLKKEKEIDNVLNSIKLEKGKLLENPYDSMDHSEEGGNENTNEEIDYLAEISIGKLFDSISHPLDKESDMFESFDKEYQERIEKEEQVINSIL